MTRRHGDRSPERCGTKVHLVAASGRRVNASNSKYAHSRPRTEVRIERYLVEALYLTKVSWLDLRASSQPSGMSMIGNATLPSKYSARNSPSASFRSSSHLRVSLNCDLPVSILCFCETNHLSGVSTV